MTLVIFLTTLALLVPSCFSGFESTTDPRLSWTPPQLDHPITVDVSASNHVLKLDPTRDYLVRMPSTKLSVLGGLVIVGGHDVVLIGGAITIRPQGHRPAPEHPRRPAAGARRGRLQRQPPGPGPVLGGPGRAARRPFQRHHRLPGDLPRARGLRLLAVPEVRPAPGEHHHHSDCALPPLAGRQRTAAAGRRLDPAKPRPLRAGLAVGPPLGPGQSGEPAGRRLRARGRGGSGLPLARLRARGVRGTMPPR